MSNFEELASAFVQSRREYDKYQKQCWDFARHFIQYYRSYLGCPDSALEPIPLNKVPAPSTSYSPMGAMHLEEDGYWHLGLRLTLDASGFPAEHLQFHIRFKGQGTNFHVCVFDDHDGFVIGPESEANYAPVYALLQDGITNYYRTGLKRFVEQASPLRTIGFVQ